MADAKVRAKEYVCGILRQIRYLLEAIECMIKYGIDEAERITLRDYHMARLAHWKETGKPLELLKSDIKKGGQNERR